MLERERLQIGCWTFCQRSYRKEAELENHHAIQMQDLQNIVVRGLGLGSVLLPAGVLLAYTAAFFGLAVWRFRFE